MVVMSVWLWVTSPTGSSRRQSMIYILGRPSLWGWLLYRVTLHWIERYLSCCSLYHIVSSNSPCMSHKPVVSDLTPGVNHLTCALMSPPTKTRMICSHCTYYYMPECIVYNNHLKFEWAISFWALNRALFLPVSIVHILSSIHFGWYVYRAWGELY